MARKPSAALRKALAHIERICAARGADEPLRLPTIAAMAVEAGVATVTMWKAVQVLRDKGALQAAPRKGVVSSGDLHAAVPQTNRYRWEDIRDGMLTALRSGNAQVSNTWPPVKELAARYGCSRDTIGRALRSLLADGVIERFGRSYRVRSAQSHVSRGTLVLLARGHSRMRLLGAGPGMRRIVRMMEETSAHMNVRMLALPVVPARNRLGIPNQGLDELDLVQNRRSLLGIIVWGADIGHHSTLIRVVRHGLARQVPVAVIEDGSRAVPARVFPVSRRLRRFILSTTVECGSTVGRFLVDNGHRCVAYISPYGDQPWSAGRLRGLREAFAASGDPTAVKPFVERVAEGDARLDDVMPEIRQAYQSIRRLEAVGRRLQTEINRSLKNARAHMNQVITMDHLSTALAPLFQRALADPSLKTWVCANDTVAVSARAFLRRAGRGVPDDISLVGFDDSDDALGADLTSYSPDHGAAIRAAINFALDPGGRPYQSGPLKPIEIKGYVVPRGSCGRLHALPKLSG
ncbi:MAG: GntR family transcriptional regulator [Chitinivibrionales bacterium]|nr:GntR family transcriptional regulator [Chitinivibrionales bacterium]